MIVNLREEFAKAWAGSDPFERVDALEGVVYRNVKGRRTLQFTHAGRSYFAKIHRGVGWGEIIKNLLTLKMPILGAENEWCAIARLHQLGLATMTAAAYGRRGMNPATRQSFIITEALENTISLEDYCAPWQQKQPPLPIKLRLIRELATISKTLHSNGVCHRDYYLCHFLLHEQEKFTAGEIAQPRLSVIDLHRALIRRKLARRWIIKDVAGLYFSALHVGLNRHDFLRFVKIYSGKSLRAALQEDADFWQRIHGKAMQLDRKINL
ncbi:MAG: lipopolysaccharide core heptose(I) kinase RfaP [Gammaproteobacteria bacterium]|nr:lipopolysaccharide core heptose(I) kinase RfaP [Gammaproteobacteria bacterium]MDP2346484.1 lipopolysaccharide core heptose(I) kinase RfaP [Gammaproteobacteria bacterium]